MHNVRKGVYVSNYFEDLGLLIWHLRVCVLMFSYGSFVHSHLSLEACYRGKGVKLSSGNDSLLERLREDSPSTTQLLRNERDHRKGDFYVIKSCELVEGPNYLTPQLICFP